MASNRRLLAQGFLAVLFWFATAGPGEAWGGIGHRIIDNRAVSLLPPEMKALFETNRDYLAEHAVDPDLLRAAGHKEEKFSHFLDLDAFGKEPFDVPLKEADHLAKHGAEAAARGRLPWRIAEGYRALIDAFQAGDPEQILVQAAILSHFVADAHVPLHATVNYDGQDTGQNGLHARWESGLLERFALQVEPGLKPPPVQVVGDPVAFSLAILRDSYRHHLEALASDRAAAGLRDLAETPEDDRYDDGYYSRLFAREGARLGSRLEAAASATASMWWSAWTAAQRPTLKTFRFPYVRRSHRAVIVLLDGAAAPLIQDAIDRGLMPQLAELRREGASATGVVPSWPAKTAAAFAALFTGAWGDQNGITGNSVSPSGASILKTESGFASTHLSAEPLWVTAARQGLSVSVASATQAYPFTPYLEGARWGGNFTRGLTLLDGYRNRNDDAIVTAADLAPTPPQVWLGQLPPHRGELKEVAVSVADTTVFGLLFDDPEDPPNGFDTLLLSPSRDTRPAVVLKPRPVSGADAAAFQSLVLPIRGEEAGVFFRLFSLSGDGRDILLYRASAQAMAASKPRVAGEALAATSGFVGNGAARLYQAGAFGPPLWRGGDGTAESRYLETVALALRQMACLTDFAFDRTAWDLLLTYFPFPDEALHCWIGYLDPTLPNHDHVLASRIRPFLDVVLALCDAQVGRLRARTGTGALFAVAADHGMVGSDRLFRPNLALRRAGLLAIDPQGQVDLTRTRAIYFPGNSGWLLINRIARPGGIVLPEEEDQVRREVAAALRSAVDPTNQTAVVTGILDPRDGHSPGLGGKTGGDLHLVVAAGFDLSPEWSGQEVELREPRGSHFQDPGSPRMQGFFAVAGPGVASGADLGTIQVIDIAPTLSMLLGIEPPAQSQGRVLEKALDRRPR